MNSTDAQRKDEYDGHISCSIGYPNAWFLEVAKRRELLFEDWVVFEIDPEPLWWDDTLYCAANAAKGRGSFVASGEAAFEHMFDLSPNGSSQTRGMLHLASSPTDDQAEALVASPIDLGLIRAIVAESEAQVATERSRLEILGYDMSNIVWKVSPVMFDARKLAGLIRSGEHPEETIVAPA